MVDNESSVEELNEQENTEEPEQVIEPDFVIELHVQNIAEALEDYFVKSGIFIEGDRFEKIFLPLNREFVSPEMTFMIAGNVLPSPLRLDQEEDPVHIDPKKLN